MSGRGGGEDGREPPARPETPAQPAATPVPIGQVTPVPPSPQ